MRQLAALVACLVLVVSCSDSDEAGELTRLVGLEDYQVLDEGQQLNFLLKACHPNIGDTSVLETGDQITVTLTEFYSPPTTTAGGEAGVQDDCQSAFIVDLGSPWNDRVVIDGSTDEVVPEVPLFD